jgi:hypothetical protein
VFQIQVAGVVDDGYTSAEVYYGDALVAIVYELAIGWRVDLFQSPRGVPLSAVGCSPVRPEQAI